MFGWWLQSEPLVRILTQYTPMVFNTALCFALTGAVLTTAALGDRRITLARIAAAAAVVTVSLLVLAEHILRVDLGVDWPALHAGLSRAELHPGRTSPGTATAFLLGGAALMSVLCLRRAWTGALVRTLTCATGLLGALGVVGYLLSARLLFPDYWFAGMAIHTAAGLCCLAIGL